MSTSERKRKPSKKAASPFPDSEFEDSVDGTPAKNPPSAKKQRANKPNKKKAAAKQAVSDDSHDEESPDSKPKKRKYSPKKGTANHAFLVVLLEAHNQGEDTLTKAEIMARADKSGIAEKPIYGTGDKGSAPFPIDGWTNFKSLKNNELVIAEGRPLKVHLTDEGRSVAEGLVAA
ncbi:hypothetical protein WJX73_007228 [Symbiochloris irregularis]|uniref:Crossover junction endonuclease MUS81 n=1 Tax=Symbiochloris irregularis TaxID=706552 RepID=A0AAW1PG35_9CHLO